MTFKQIKTSELTGAALDWAIVNPVTLQALIDATYAVLAENSRHLKHTSKLEKLEFLLDDVETYYLKDLEN